jgi:glycine/D-amino acid oxidase-like deaminating enzyme
MGLCAAWALVRRGVRVAVIDPAGPGAGASGGLVGALAPHAPDPWDAKKAFQLQALRMAPGFWAAVAAAGGGDPGYARTGRLAQAPDPARARTRAQAAAANWAATGDWRLVGAEGNPWGLAPMGGQLARDTLTARIDPRRAVAALTSALAASGVTVAAEAPDRGLVVHATGQAGLRALMGPDAPPLAGGEKGQAARLAFAAPDWPQVYLDGLYLVPHADGTVAVGSTSERTWVTDSGTDHQLETLIDRARRLAPALRDARVLDRWAGIRPRWPTRAPLLGPWPGRPGHLIANGLYKTGFALAPLLAERLADLIVTGQADLPDGMRPDVMPPAA